MAKSKRGLDYPLAIHIIRLQHYKPFFDLSEIVLFEWFVVKGESFSYKKFYYSNRRITEEVKIKDDRLRRIISRFTELGIISHTLEGLPYTHHYIVHYDNIYNLLEDIYNLTENSKLLPYYSQLLAEYIKHKEYKKEVVKEVVNKEYNMPAHIQPDPQSSPAGSSNLNIDINTANTNTAKSIAIQNHPTEALSNNINTKQELIKSALDPVKKGMAEVWSDWIKKTASLNIAPSDFQKGYWESLKKLAKMLIERSVEHLEKVGKDYILDDIVNTAVFGLWQNNLLNKWDLLKGHWTYDMNDPNKILKHFTTIIQIIKDHQEKPKPKKIIYPTY